MKNKDSFLSLSPQVTIVEASAGSGKTYCLAARYVRLLINQKLKPEEIPLRDILAVTFSNKAAFEMKERILDFLKKLALDEFLRPEEKKEFLNYLSVSEDFARAKAGRILDELMQHYNFFQVQTIDSFINAILSGCAFKFNLSAGFKIKHSYRQYLAYSFDKFIDTANKDMATLKVFLGFLKQYIYLENKKSWLPKADILSIMEALFSLSNIYGARFIKYDLKTKDLVSQREQIRKLMLELKKKMPEGINMQTWGSFVNSFGEGTESAQIDKFFNPFSKDEFKMKKNFSSTDEALKLWQDLKCNIAQLYEGKAFSLFNCYIDIFNGITDYFEDISRKEDILFLSQLNNHVHRLLGQESGIVPELYYRLATRFRHFLIDEFQDTSLLQWKNLFLMVEEALSTGGSLFYVGDKKQAIYRFRGGDVSLIEEVKKELRVFNLAEEVLSKNYRSQKEVVEFNNFIFSRDNLLSLFVKRREHNKLGTELSPEDIEDILSVFKEAKQTYREENNKGYVRLEVIEAQDKEEADEIVRGRVITLIGGLKERFSYGDLAVLARSNKEVELFTSWLLEEGIPVESEKTLNIRENAHIKELLSLLRFLNSPIDNLSFASFILGDIFIKASGLEKKALQRFLFILATKKKTHPDYLYIEFRKEFPKPWDELIAEFLKNVGLAPLYELMISMMRKFRVMDNFPGYQGFFMKFLELIKTQEEDNQSLSLFLEFFETVNAEELYVNVSGEDALKVLTIHKSKGLEFPVVIIPFLEMNVRGPGGAWNNNGSFVAYPDSDGLRLNYLVKDECLGFSPLLKGRYLEEYKKSFIDELNNVYVALTRAKYELYIFCPKKSVKGLNFASLLIPEEGLERGGKIEYGIKNNQKHGVTKEIEASRYQDWIQFLKNEFQEEALIKKREALLRGDILHYLLSHIGNLTVEDKDGLLKEALVKARLRFPSIAEWGGFESAISKLLSDNSFKPFFFIEDGLVYQEKELVNSYGATKRIDRLVVTQNEVLILDYKSSRLNNENPPSPPFIKGGKGGFLGESYKKQLVEYMVLVRDIYPKLKVRGFLIYLDELELEEINGKDNKL